MQRKIFIAIIIDDKTRKFIESKIIQWKNDLPLSWISPEKYHLTLEYLGFVEDEDVGKICGQLRGALQHEEAFDLKMNEFCWGPNEKKPKMAWLKGEKNSNLSSLRSKITKTIYNFEADGREFSPHITLGRIKGSGRMSQLPKFAEITNIIIPVTSVVIMESVIESGRRKYFVMESIDLA